MDRRFALRKVQMCEQCVVRAESVGRLPAALSNFIRPFAERLCDVLQRGHAQQFCEGLLSNMNRKNTEAIAYEQDQERHNLQHFIGSSPWEHKPLIDELCSQVGAALGEADGVIVIDPSGFPKQGRKSAGVARQWCGRLGKVANCQVGIFLAYVSRREQVLCDFRLFLPQEWTKDRERCRAVGVPPTVVFQTRHAQALEMIRSRRETLPHAWITADDEFGKVGHFRRDPGVGKRFPARAIPGNITARILDSEEVPHCGPGGPAARRFVSVTAIRDQLPATAWQSIDVRDGEKGPLVVEVALVPHVQTLSNRRKLKYAEVLIFTRYQDEQGTRHDDTYLSNAPASTPAAEFARVISAERRVEEAIRRAKSEAGLADYQARTWQGWHHHQTLSLIAIWFLVSETLTGRQTTPALTVPQVRQMIARTLQQQWIQLHPQSIANSATRQLQRNEEARFYHHKKRNRLPPLRSEQRR